MKVVIAGSRSIVNPMIIVEAIVESGFAITEVVSGGAQGVDSLAEKWATQNEIPVTIFSPDWKQFGRRAGPIRNSEMAGYADALIAIWEGKSKGTKDMITKAEKAGLKVFVLTLRPDQVN